MKAFTNYLNHSNLGKLLVAAVSVLFFVGFALPAFAQMEQTIPENANRIIIEQEGVPPADAYVDAINMFELMDWEIIASEETLILDNLREINDTEPLVFAAKKQVTDDMALRISGNVDAIPGGGEMMISAEYAEDVDTPVPEWKQASWTSGKAKEAFQKTLDIIRHSAYDAVDFEIGVSVVAK